MNNKQFKIVKGFETLESRLDKLYKNTDTLSIFQTIPFYNFFNNQKNTESFVYSILKDDEIIGSVFGVILYESGLKKYLTKRAIINGGPVLSNKETQNNYALKLLLKHIHKQLKYKAIYIETRNLTDYSLYKNTFEECGFDYIPYVNIQIDISDLDVAFMKFKSEKRRQVRKALKQDVKIQIAESKNDVESLYNILSDLYTTKVKKPLPELIYFLNLFETFINNNNGFVCLLVYKNEIIGGAFCPYYKNTVYDLYRCGLDKKFKNLYPSTLAVYAGMSIANKKGLKLYDFMGAGNKNIPYGVRDFKSQFGGELVEYGRFLKVLNPFLYSIGKLALKIIQKIK